MTADFRRLWIGAAVSTFGDGLTFVALAWLVLAQPHGTARLGLLGVCYTAPVVVGGLVVGPLLDRFDKRVVLADDSVLRAAAVASIPVTAAVGTTPSWLPFAVAATYGLLKMVPLAGFPAAIPQLVDEAHLDRANALESLSFSVANVVGPAAAGLLISRIGAADVLLVDSATFVFFAVAAMRVRRPLRPQPKVARAGSIKGLARDRVIVLTTVAFMAFNVAEGMLMVTAPWLAKHQLTGSAATLGFLLSALAAGEIAGVALAARRPPGRSRLKAIGIVQIAAACAFLGLLAASASGPSGPAAEGQGPAGQGAFAPVVVAGAFFLVGLFSAPMTIWAQSLRMRRIPQPLHGRAFAALRTLMQATPPIGAALATPLLERGEPGLAALAMSVVAGVPALLLLYRAEQDGDSPAPLPVAWKPNSVDCPAATDPL